jgi:arginase family enzyme
VKTTAVFFPFDLFGNSGTRAGAELLADAVREMLADNRRERVATRSRAYTNKVRVNELTFETAAEYQDWRARGREAARAVLDRNDFLLWCGGNHLGVLPVLDELSADAERTLVVQFDAHLDVYNLSDCTAELSHGNFLLHCAGPLPRIVHVGHRDLFLKPDYAAKYIHDVVPAAELILDPEPALDRLRRLAAEANRVFLDVDCDVFDPAHFPAVAQPQPFGLHAALFLRCLDAVWSGRVVGLALSEFDPARDDRDHGLATLLWLIEYVLLRRHER